MDKADVETPDVTREEVEKAMTKRKNGKAAGNDNIAAELLKNGGEAMVDWVPELAQEVWRTRKVPQEWKDTTLVPLFQKKDQKICDLSLLRVPWKVLTLILLDKLQAIIDPQLMEAQCGLREK